MSATVLKLYDTVDALLIVENWIYEHEDELRASEGVLPQELADLLATAEIDFKGKVERVWLFIRELTLTAAAAKEEEARLQLRRKHYLNAAEGLKGYLLCEMERAGQLKVEGKLANVRVQKSPPSCRIEREIPEAELAELHKGDERLVIYTPPQPARWLLNPSGVIAAARQVDAKDKVTGYKSPIIGVVVEQGSHVRGS